MSMSTRWRHLPQEKMSKRWVAYETPAGTFIDKVSIEGCEDVDDFRGIIDMNII
jgi:hypothetical protein